MQYKYGQVTHTAKAEAEELIADILFEESKQWTREAEGAIYAADPSHALQCLRKATDASILKMQYSNFPAGAHVLQFSWFVGLCGDSQFFKDLIELAEFNVRVNQYLPLDVWTLEEVQRLDRNISTSRAILAAVRSEPGASQAQLGRDLGMSPSSFARHASALCDGRLLVAAKRKNRIYLWPSDDQDAPPASERRPADEDLYTMKYQGKVIQTGAAWEELRINVMQEVAAAEQQPETSATILDVLGAGFTCLLADTRGIPLILDRDNNAMTFGHIDLKKFRAAARGAHRGGDDRPKGWQGFPARHTWMVVHSRAGWQSVLREVAQHEVGCLPVTVIKVPSNYLDARPRPDQHYWLPAEGTGHGRPRGPS